MPVKTSSDEEVKAVRAEITKARDQQIAEVRAAYREVLRVFDGTPEDAAKKWISMQKPPVRVMTQDQIDQSAQEVDRALFDRERAEIKLQEAQSALARAFKEMSKLGPEYWVIARYNPGYRPTFVGHARTLQRSQAPTVDYLQAPNVSQGGLFPEDILAAQWGVFETAYIFRDKELAQSRVPQSPRGMEVVSVAEEMLARVRKYEELELSRTLLYHSYPSESPDTQEVQTVSQVLAGDL